MSTTGPLPVDEHWRLSVGHTTIELEGTTKQVGPDRSCNSMRSGPRPTSKGTTGLMFIVEPTADTPPPPTCPACGGRAESTTGIHADTKIGTVVQFYICAEGHLYSMRWLGGVA